MNKEERKLLYTDLCARVPHKVRCQAENGLGGGKTDRGVLKYVGNCNGVISHYYEDVPIDSGFINNVFYPIENIKPYLRPMSSMTKEEYETFPIPYSFDSFSTWNNTILSEVIEGTQILIGIDEITEIIDWLNRHHFDYRGLIERGLALEAPDDMYSK